MHFSKTFAQLLLTLPPELRENAIEYRQLKKLINKVVNELASLGLSPAVLQELLEQRNNAGSVLSEQPRLPPLGLTDPSTKSPYPRVVYEFSNASNPIEPRLRLWVKGSRTEALDPYPSHASLLKSTDVTCGDSDLALSDVGLEDMIYTTQIFSPDLLLGDAVMEDAQELVIPLLSNTAFFQLLSTALQSLSAHLLTVRSGFINTLQTLSRDISLSARPVSSTSSFHPHSSSSDPASIAISSPNFATRAKSDLYSWREIFQLYVEAEVFESVSEADRGERGVEDVETRLQAFAERVTKRELVSKLRLRNSRSALETFLELNAFILNIKKFQFANAEATRKILKKHTKRTSLPLPASANCFDLALVHRDSTSLPRVLVQAIGEILLPIIPHVDDYECLICTSIAFKPIRLFCGHLFCVRCLVKMQKRGKGNCPMCRAPTVLKADRANVDWALLNFMQDWFPVEAKAKLKSNEREAAEEEMEELGLNTHGCIIS